MPSIPGTVDELTAGWFSEVLDAHITGADLLDAHSGTTGRALVRLTGDSAVPETVFVKLQPFEPRQREFLRMTGLGVAEAKLYAAAGNELPVRIPGVLYTDFDDADSFIMVLEDLVAAGCRFPSPDDPDVIKVAESLMDELALLHASYWEQELPWLGRHAVSSSASKEQGKRAAGGAAIVQSAIDQFADDLPPEFRQLGE